MDLALSREFAHVPSLWDQVQDLRWFRDSFTRGTEVLARQINADAELDDGRSALAFLSWSEKLSLQQHYSLCDRQAYCTFACGLLLAELIRAAPLRISRATRPIGRCELTAEARAVAEFWREGFILTSYCAGLLEAILRQDFQHSVTLAPAAGEIRTWWSFRENAQEEPARAIGFFDLFLGNEPHWQDLESFPSRAGVKREAGRKT